MKKVLITATVQSHIAQFHEPLINMLKEKGVEVHVAARDNLMEKPGLSIKNVDKIFNVNFSRSPFNRKNIKSYIHLKKLITTGNYDVIHCNTPMGGVITRLASHCSRKKGTKVLYTAHGFHFYTGAPILNWIVYYPIEKILSFFTDVLITISKDDFNMAVTKKFNCDIRRINGVGFNPNDFPVLGKEEIDNIKQREKIENNEIILLSIGELNKNKNQITTIKALGTLVNDYPNVILLLAGNGPNLENLKKEISKLSLENNVRFLGYTRKVSEFINISDIVISMSHREGLAVNILEALSTRKLVIASKNRGHNELIIDGENGFLIEANDHLSLSENIRNYIQDRIENKQEILSNTSQSIIQYSSKNVANELKKIYEEVL